MKKILLGVSALVLVSACSTGSDIGTQNDYIAQYNGHPLHCVVYDRGISCDWVRYHQEFRQ